MYTETHAAPLRLMTYNIHRWEGRDNRLDVERLEGVIRSAGADMVGLNEVLHPVTDVSGTREPLAELAERLGMYFAFGPSGWRDRGPGWSGPVGNALLSRYPLRKVTNRLLPRAPGTKQRSLLGAAVAGGSSQGLSFFVTHLDHAFEGTRLLQLEGLLGAITSRGPHFVAGDFNTPGFLGRRSRRLLPPVLRRMGTAGYTDAFGSVGIGSGKTYPSDMPIFRIDFLFVPRRWAGGLRGARAINTHHTQAASDHRPVVAEWTWPETAGR